MATQLVRAADTKRHRQPAAKRAKIAAACLAQADDMTPPPERRQHDRLVEGERLVTDASGHTTRTSGLSVITQTPLDRYRVMSYVGETQWQAGDRLRSCFEQCCFEHVARVMYDRAGTAGGNSNDPADIPLRAISARRAYLQALQALPNKVAAVVVHVSCHRGSASDWAANRGLPRADGMALLRLGLDILYDHYSAAKKAR